MKRVMAISIAIIMLISGSISDLLAQDGLTISLITRKDVSASGESYKVNFDLEGDVLKNTRKVYITVPRNKNMMIRNRLNLNKITLESINTSYEDFIDAFPEGTYNFYLFPRLFKNSRNVLMSHDFPNTPVLIYPTDGASTVPLTPIIEWAQFSSSDIDNLFLEIKGIGLNYRIELLPNTTSLALPIGLLKPITQYTLSLGAKKTTDSQGSYRESARVITFTTGTI
jgi:hypothetical protein